MQNKCTISRETKDGASDELMRKCADYVLKNYAPVFVSQKQGYDPLRRSSKTAKVVLVDKKRMRQLNRVYHGADAPTDVLSFANGEESYLGEVVICPFFVRYNAKRTKRTLQWEFCHAVVHGILHLLGYTHDTTQSYSKMHAMEESIIKNVLSKIKNKKLKINKK